MQARALDAKMLKGSNVLGLAATLVLLATPGAGFAGSAVEQYQETLRQYLIARHCDLVTEDVMSGFRVKVMTLHSLGNVTSREGQQYRAAVNEAVRRDWRNRGMGAQDPRCRTEGRAAAQRLVEFLYTDD